MNDSLSPFERGIQRRTRERDALLACTVKLTQPASTAPRDIAGVTRGFDRPLSHAESFTEPLEMSAGLSNANIACGADGKPEYWRGKIKKIIDNLPEFTPGTFAKVGGKLKKASAKSSIHNQRWHNPSTAGQAHKHNPSIYKYLPTVHQLEAAREEVWLVKQRKVIAKLAKKKFKEPARAKSKPTDLLERITAHNGTQHTGPRDRPRLSCPELARRKVRRRKQPVVTPEERAAALALLNTPIILPKPVLHTAPPEPVAVRTTAPTASAWGTSRL